MGLLVGWLVELGLGMLAPTVWDYVLLPACLMLKRWLRINLSIFLSYWPQQWCLPVKWRPAWRAIRHEGM